LDDREAKGKHLLLVEIPKEKILNTMPVPSPQDFRQQKKLKKIKTFYSLILKVQ